MFHELSGFRHRTHASWRQCIAHQYSLSALDRDTSYTLGLPFEGDSLYGMLVGAAIIGLFSCVAAVLMLRCIARTRLVATCVSTILALLIGGGLGTSICAQTCHMAKSCHVRFLVVALCVLPFAGAAVSVLPAVISSTPTTVDYDRCGDRIIDSTQVDLLKVGARSRMHQSRYDS